MPLLPLNIRPGIHTDVSPYSAGAAGGYIINGSNIRWVKGFMAPRGGLQQGAVNITEADGEVRDVHFWQDQRGETFAVIGTTVKVLLIYRDSVHDITPTGLTLDGRLSYDSGVGWGVGGWGEGTWGTPRPLTDAEFEPIQWSFANFGEDLLIVLRNNGVYYWDRSGWTNQATPPKAVRLDTLTPQNPTTTGRIPNVGREIIVTSPDRHIMVGGVDPIDNLDSVINPMLVRWSARQSLTDWNPDEDDTSGDILLTEGNEIMAMISTQQQNLVLTDYAAYTMNYSGAEFAFVPQLIGTNCGAISKDSVVDVNGTAYWMGEENFYVYAGGLATPIPCSVKYKVYDEIDPDSRKLIFAGVNPEYNEITWFYRKAGASGTFYATYNYVEQWWSLGEYGNLTAWSDTGGIYDKPVVFVDGTMHFAEQPQIAVDTLAETAPLELAAGTGQGVEQGEFYSEGGSLLYVHRLIPDFEYVNGIVNFQLRGRKYPSGDEIVKPWREVGETTTKVDIKFRGRQLRMLFRSDGIYRMGTWRAELSTDGRR